MGTYNTKTILITNQKGGVGKTFIADELCFMCEEAALPYTFRDMDGQGGCIHEPKEEKDPALIIIDTPGALTEGLQEAIRDADLIIIPTLMTTACIPALETMLEIVKPWKMMGKDVLVVLNQWNRYTACADFEEWFFNNYPREKTITLSDSEVIRQATSFGISVTQHKKHSKSAVEMRVFREVIMDMLLEKLKQQAMDTSPVVNDKRVKVTLSMTQEESNKLKKLAIDEGKTVSALVREWMYEKM